MYGMQELFDQLAEESFKPNNMLSLIIEIGLNNIGINLSKKQKQDLKSQLGKADEGGSLNFDFSDKQIAAAGYKSEEDLKPEVEKILGNISSVVDDIVGDPDEFVGGLINGVAESIAISLCDELEKGIETVREHREAGYKEFIEGVLDTWGVPLDYLQALIEISEESYGKTFDRDDEYFNDDLTQSLLLEFQTKAIQVSKEIFILLRNGFPDGAQARWRKLHEISVVSIFIAEHGDELAKSFEEHQSIENYKRAIQYNEYYSRLSSTKIPISEINELKKEYDILIKKYSDSYRHEFGWAAKALKMKKPTFKDIELSIELDHHRPYYKLASADIHANPSGVFETLGLFPEDDYMLAGPSYIGLCQPASMTIISLNIITTTLLTYSPSLDCIALCRVLQKFGKKAESEFIKVEEEIYASWEGVNV